jgi:hypothetical protein
MEHLVRSSDRSSDFVLFGELAMHAPVMREAIRGHRRLSEAIRSASIRSSCESRPNLAQTYLVHISFISRAYLAPGALRLGARILIAPRLAGGRLHSHSHRLKRAVNVRPHLEQRYVGGVEVVRPKEVDVGGEGIRVARHKGFDCAWQIDVPHVPAHLMREAIRLMREAISLDEGGRLTSHTPPRTKNSLYPLLRCAPARRSLVSLR